MMANRPVHSFYFRLQACSSYCLDRLWGSESISSHMPLRVHTYRKAATVVAQRDRSTRIRKEDGGKHRHLDSDERERKRL